MKQQLLTETQAAPQTNSYTTKQKLNTMLLLLQLSMLVQLLPATFDASYAKLQLYRVFSAFVSLCIFVHYLSVCCIVSCVVANAKKTICA